jgi:hypothetical protein
MVRERLEKTQALYALDLPVLEQLRPDLIVTQTLCDVCAVADEEVQAAACALPGTPRVIHLEPTTLGQVLDSIEQVASATGTSGQGDAVVQRLKLRVDAVAPSRRAPIASGTAGSRSSRELHPGRRVTRVADRYLVTVGFGFFVRALAGLMYWMRGAGPTPPGTE